MLLLTIKDISNASLQLLPEARARYEQALEAVSHKALFGSGVLGSGFFPVAPA